ncbi:hypothetical protein [Bradyrhizobium sp. NP1]|nr:hypothetical protein [Bradyrhizobium sp. NP1]WJR77497.1 hypothetical protein QOU61_33065 [Bradyrhizobium sp. NP1]
MATTTIRRARDERLQELLMIASFTFWATLLGFAPVFVFHSLAS